MEKHDAITIDWPMGTAYYMTKEKKLYFGNQILLDYRQELRDILDEKWYYDSPKKDPNQLEFDFTK